MLKFSEANAKIRALADVPAIQPYLTGNRKVYSFDILSGHNCPYAKDCHSKVVVQEGGKRKVVDGKFTQFRCFSASQEALYTPLYNLRSANSEIVSLAAVSVENAFKALMEVMPKNAGVIRIHVGGDFATRPYFKVWSLAAIFNPKILFYAYTKSLPFIINRPNIPNFVLTASKGGMKDSLIEQYNLRQAVVVHNQAEADSLGLEVDHDDSHAADPSKRNQSFALIVHGLQPAGSTWGKAVKANRGEGSYKR